MCTLVKIKMLHYFLHFSMVSIPLMCCVQKLYKNNIILLLQQILFITCITNTIVILTDILYRLSYLLVMLKSILDNGRNLSSVAQALFTFNNVSIVIMALNGLILFVFITTRAICPIKYIWDFGPYIGLSSIVFTLFLLRAVNFYQWSLPQSFVSSMRGLDYGTGMAYSYFYGYLRIVLPSSGTTSKGLLEQIENFEDVHNVTVSVKKLFILVPYSSYIPPNLKEMSNGWIESAVPLEGEVRNRGGVLRRSYHNSVYKIYPGGRENNVQPVYIVAEGATPILTLFDIQRHSNTESAVYTHYSKEIINAFCAKLKELLHSNPDCKDLAEIICYSDYDNSLNKVNVAKILWDRVSVAINIQ